MFIIFHLNLCLLTVTVIFRQLINIRVSKPRREFGLDNIQLIDKEAAETTTDLKFVAKSGGSIQRRTTKKVLNIGL